MGGQRQKHLWVKAPATETKHLPHHPPTPETTSSRRTQALYPSAPQPPSPELTAPRPFLQPPPRPPPPPAPGRPGSGGEANSIYLIEVGVPGDVVASLFDSQGLAAGIGASPSLAAAAPGGAEEKQPPDGPRHPQQAGSGPAAAQRHHGDLRHGDSGDPAEPGAGRARLRGGHRLPTQPGPAQVRSERKPRKEMSARPRGGRLLPRLPGKARPPPAGGGTGGARLGPASAGESGAARPSAA